MKFKLSVKDLLKCYGADAAAKQIRINCDSDVSNKIYRIDPNDKIALTKYLRNINETFEISDDLLGVMSLVNKMVKDKVNCSSNHRNRFYDLKHRTIKKMMKYGLVTDIIDNGDNYLFIINGYEFHQPKRYFGKNPITTVKNEPYVPSVRNVEFNYDTYKIAMATMSYFILTFEYKNGRVFKMKVSEVEKYKKELIDMLYHLNEGQLNFFKRLWVNNDMDITIEDAVNNLDVDKLSIIHYQAKNTLKKK